MARISCHASDDSKRWPPRLAEVALQAQAHEDRERRQGDHHDDGEYEQHGFQEVRPATSAPHRLHNCEGDQAEGGQAIQDAGDDEKPSEPGPSRVCLRAPHRRHRAQHQQADDEADENTGEDEHEERRL
ncbi:MAG: hypothetical protein R3B90_04190 [Planctomycetaceae bacterium]